MGKSIYLRTNNLLQNVSEEDIEYAYEYGKMQMALQEDWKDPVLVPSFKPEYTEYAIVTPWYEPVEGQYLTTDGAVKAYGEDAVKSFISDAKNNPRRLLKRFEGNTADVYLVKENGKYVDYCTDGTKKAFALRLEAERNARETLRLKDKYERFYF